MKVQVVIPSKNRQNTIADHTLKLFPHSIVCVDEAEVDAYAKALDAHKHVQILGHPGVDKLPTLCEIRNWILDNVEGEALCMVDDDVRYIRAMAGWHPRDSKDPEIARAVLENTAECAKEAGAALWGFNQQPNPLHYHPQQPIRLDTWVGTVIGFIGKHHGLRYDPMVPLHDDVDLCLQSLLKHRIVWCDDRWCFINYRLVNAGGLAAYRSAAKYESESHYLKRKWGKYVKYQWVQSTLTTGLRVPRKQSLSL